MHMYKMELHCLKCKKNTENIDPDVSSTSNGRVMILYLQNVQYVVVKNSDLLNTKKQKDY